jgi:hemerythrin-like domain-containing protein
VKQISLPGADALAPTFDDPLGMLEACHGRISAQCALLDKLAKHLDARRWDEQVAQAATQILRYFDTAGQFHHQDEELDLFPQLLASGDPAAAGLMAALLAEHRELEQCWRALRPELLGLTLGASTRLEEGVVSRFNAGYAAHIALENTRLLPLAERLLDFNQRAVLGKRMAARRGFQG